MNSGSGWFKTIIYQVCSALHTCGVVVWICLVSSWEQWWGRRLGYPPPAVAFSYSSWCHGAAVVPPLPDTPAHKKAPPVKVSQAPPTSTKKGRVWWIANTSCVPLKCDQLDDIIRYRSWNTVGALIKCALPALLQKSKNCAGSLSQCSLLVLLKQCSS